MVHQRSAFLLTFVFLLCLPAQGQIRLDPLDAERLVVQRVTPQFPALARQARIESIVNVEIVVGETGDLTSVRILAGHPLLDGSVIESLSNRRYRPYIVAGKPVPFVTLLQFQFLGGTVSDVRYDQLRKQDDPYARQTNTCIDLLSKKQWPEAEKSCQATLPLAASDDQRRASNERMGHVFLGQGRYSEALPYFEASLRFAGPISSERNVELAYAFRNVAIATHGMGNLNRARELYINAERIFTNVIPLTTAQSLKTDYENILRLTLQLHLQAAEQSGAADEVQSLRQRLAQTP